MEDEVELMERNMDLVFEIAKVKAFCCIKKHGNTATPWLDFTTGHLIKRLDGEIDEWKESGNSQELLDIINLAVFVWLSRFYDIVGDEDDIFNGIRR